MLLRCCKTLYSSQKKVGANAEVLRVPSGVNMQLSSAGLYQGQEKSKRKMEREQNWTEARAGKRAVQVSEEGEWQKLLPDLIPCSEPESPKHCN